MHPATAFDLAFLLPGLSHQFGNLLFTVQGHAATCDAATLPRAKAAIGGACDRGAASLRLLRHVLGECPPEPAAAATALAQLAELLRIPVREAGHVFEADTNELRASAASIELGSFAPLVLACVRALVHAAPDGLRGVLRLAWSDDAQRLVLTLRPQAGGLPFPLALAEAATQLAARGLVRGGYALRATATGFELALPAVRGLAEA